MRTGNTLQGGRHLGTKSRTRTTPILAILFAALVGGCGYGPSLWATKVRDVLEHPERYVGTEITLSGKVTNVKVPLLLGIYWLEDGTGEIPVITQGQAPLNAAKIRLLGRVEYLATFRATSIGLHVAELQRR